MSDDLLALVASSRSWASTRAAVRQMARCAPPMPELVPVDPVSAKDRAGEAG